MGDMTEPTICAATYARWRASTLGRITERVEVGVVLGLAGQLAGKRVLDVGTGDGTYALEAAAWGAVVTGIDLDPVMLAAARTRAKERGLSATFETGRAEALPFADGTFDVVLAVTVLCLVSDARIAAREMARLLAPGGRLVIGELGRYSIWAAERRVDVRVDLIAQGSELRRVVRSQHDARSVVDVVDRCVRRHRHVRVHPSTHHSTTHSAAHPAAAYHSAATVPHSAAHHSARHLIGASPPSCERGRAAVSGRPAW